MATEKAKLIASAVRGGTVFVYAASSKDPVLAATHAYKTLNKMAASAFECSACGSQQHVVASSAPEPYCIVCGSDRVIESNRKVPETAAFVSDDELASVTCGACSTDNVLPLKAVKASNCHLHCVTCGGDLAIAETETEDDKEEADFADAPAVTPSAGGDAAEDVSGEDDFPEVSETEEEPEEEMAEAESEDDNSFTEESDALDGIDELELQGEEVLPEPTFEADDLETPNFSDMGVEEPGNEEQLFLDDLGELPPADAGEPMLDALELNDTPEGLEFMSKANVLLAMKGAHVVAFAGENHVGRNADILHSPEFAKAVVMTAKKIGVRKALARMGFRDIYVKPVDVKSSAREIAKAKSQFDAKAHKAQKVFADSLAIASVGMAKGLFKEFKDPIRSAVEAQLGASMGTRVAKVTASRIMAANGIEYAKSLISLANKLSGMTEQVRKEYAEMCDLVDDGGETADLVSADADEMPNNEFEQSGIDDGEDITDTSEDLDSVQSRLTTAAVLLKPRNSVTASGRKASPSASASAILAGTAPLRFSA